MACIHFDGGVICGIPDAHGEAIVDGRLWRWDYSDSPGGGPLFVGIKGEPLKNQNPPRRVWDSFQEWCDEWRARHRP